MTEAIKQLQHDPELYEEFVMEGADVDHDIVFNPARDKAQSYRYTKTPINLT